MNVSRSCLSGGLWQTDRSGLECGSTRETNKWMRWGVRTRASSAAHSTIITLSSEKWPARTQDTSCFLQSPVNVGRRGGGWEPHRQRTYMYYIYHMAENTCCPLLRLPAWSRMRTDAAETHTYASTPSSQHVSTEAITPFLIHFTTIGFCVKAWYK